MKLEKTGNTMELNFEVLEMQKLNMEMDAAQIDGKNRVICLFILFHSRVMVIKISKIAHFMYFFLITSSKQSRLEQII